MIAKKCAIGATLLLSWMAAMSASATTITIVNNDGPGEGFNDSSAPPAGAGCAPSETLGQCRLHVFQTAADNWAVLLNSSVVIKVLSQMNPQTCTATGTVLGSAGAISTAANFPNAPRTNISYNIAEANALAGQDLDPGNNDINATFNISIDSGCATGTVGWWYGTDPAIAIPTNRIGLLPVVFHELGHGLGFTSNTNPSSGAFYTSQPPIWASYLFDTETGKLWKNMSNGERAASAINDPNLVWTGPHTGIQAAAYLGPGPALLIDFPLSLASTNSVGTGAFGAPIVAPGTTANLVRVDDGSMDDGMGGTTATINDGCQTPYVNAGAVSGKIALVDRGSCAFTVKAKNAQLNGAIGVIIANVASSANPNTPPGMAGSDATITIPVVSIAFPLGEQIRTVLGGGAAVHATIGTARLSLTDGCVRLFAPNPVQSGSSVSHFSPDATPNLLMEPAITATIFNKVDLTLPLFKDIDWPSNLEDFLFVDGFDSNPCQHVQP